MMKHIFKKLFVLLFIAAALAACSSAAYNNPTQAPVPQTGGNTGGNTGGTTKEVKIASFAFDPATLTVPVGTTVKWTNQDSAAHTVTADEKRVDSGQLAQGKSFSFTFSKEGTFAYKCTNHPSMVAKIIVTK